MQVILFDIDGTLINSDGAGRRAINRVFADLYGIEDALRTVQLHGRTDPRIIRDGFEFSLKRTPSKAEIDKIIIGLVECLAVELKNSPGYSILPGVSEILDHLHTRNDILLGLQTGNAEAAAELKLSHGKIWDYFRFGGFGSDSDLRPDVVAHAIRKAERLLPLGERIENVWVVGDTPDDIEAGKTAGARTLATATGMHELELLLSYEPDLGVPNLSEVSFIVETLLGRG